MSVARTAPRASPKTASRITARYRWAVLSRTLAATVGGYALTAVASVAMAFSLPLAKPEAVSVSLMASFLVYLLAVLWCFACRDAVRAWVGVGVPALLLGGLDHWVYGWSL